MGRLMQEDSCHPMPAACGEAAQSVQNKMHAFDQWYVGAASRQRAQRTTARCWRHLRADWQHLKQKVGKEAGVSVRGMKSSERRMWAVQQMWGGGRKPLRLVGLGMPWCMQAWEAHG